MEWKDYIADSEEIRAKFEYDFKSIVHKTIGITNKRAFCYEKVRNEEKFVTSQKAISHLEYGEWKVPWYAWFTLILEFILGLWAIIETVNLYSIVGFVPGAIFLAVAIYFKKFEFLISAVGSEKFHVISRKQSVLTEIKTFIKKLHNIKQVGENASEVYINSNYYTRLLNRFLFIITFEFSFFISLGMELFSIPPLPL